LSLLRRTLLLSEYGFLHVHCSHHSPSLTDDILDRAVTEDLVITYQECRAMSSSRQSEARLTQELHAGNQVSRPYFPQILQVFPCSTKVECACPASPAPTIVQCKQEREQELSVQTSKFYQPLLKHRVVLMNIQLQCCIVEDACSQLTCGIMRGSHVPFQL
jgi:hypothetical protein